LVNFALQLRFLHWFLAFREPKLVTNRQDALGGTGFDLQQEFKM